MVATEKLKNQTLNSMAGPSRTPSKLLKVSIVLSQCIFYGAVIDLSRSSRSFDCLELRLELSFILTSKILFKISLLSFDGSRTCSWIYTYIVINLRDSIRRSAHSTHDILIQCRWFF